MMKFEKTVLGEMEKSYSVAVMEIGGQAVVLFGSEVRQNGMIFGSRTERFSTPGGVMSMVPWPGQTPAFGSIYGFYPPFKAEGSGLLKTSRRTDGAYESRKLLEIPYLHRFEIISSETRNWLVLSVLCREKTDREDWSSPGYVAVLPLEQDGSLRERQPFIILDRQFHNHGMWKGTLNGKSIILTSSDQGVFACYPSDTVLGWRVEQLIDVPTGEAAVCDLDGDGIDELVTIAPFHGSSLSTYKYASGWDKAWSCPYKMEFLHALWAGEFHGKKMVFCGSRKDEGCLRAFWQSGGEWESQVIDKGVASSNVCVAKLNNEQCLLSSNHGRNECAVYKVKTDSM